MDTDYGRIHRVPFKVAVSVLFTTAMLAASGRFAIRLVYQKHLLADDYVLLFACLLLIACFAMIMVMFKYIYFSMSVMVGPIDVVVRESMSPTFTSTIKFYSQLSNATAIMCWGIVFVVKISYLVFFRHMVDRVRIISTFWSVTMGVVVASGIYCVCAIPIACSRYGIEAFECVQYAGYRRTLITILVANSLNMLTDLLIAAIPILLLRKVKIRLVQKFVLGGFLCLSFCMFIICLFRTFGETIHANTGPMIDPQWNIFWLFLEASVAVTVVSLTAFRSLYSFKASQENQNNQQKLAVHSYKRNLLYRKSKRRVDEFGDSVSDQHASLPVVPGTTVTGMRPITDGSHRPTVSVHKSAFRESLNLVDEV